MNEVNNMGIWVGRNRKARRAYGFDDITLVPGNTTIDPSDTNTSFMISDLKFDIPIIAAAMDGVVNPLFANLIGGFGGLGVLNLEGLQCKYENPSSKIDEIIRADKKSATKKIQELYQKPTSCDLIVQRVKEIKKNDKNIKTAVSCTPQFLLNHFNTIKNSNEIDILFIQSTVATVEYISSTNKTLNLAETIKKLNIPLVIGNTVNFNTAYELMDIGASGILVGVGPGAACTTREVLGIGVPQITATCDVAAARDLFYKKTGKYISVITDGGMKGGGDISKSVASGADAVMLGSILATSHESPGKGYHWGMATPSIALPRGTRIYVGQKYKLEEVLFGPSHNDNGTSNIVGALKNSMGNCGAYNIKDMHLIEMIVAPSIKVEGKQHQITQNVGMYEK